MFNPSLYIAELKGRLKNPAISDEELTQYLLSASRKVKETEWSEYDYKELVLLNACQGLLSDNKFPEIQSVSSQGVSTSFSSNDPERFLKQIANLRLEKWLDNG